MTTGNQTYNHMDRPCVVLFDTRDSSLKGVLAGRFGPPLSRADRESLSANPGFRRSGGRAGPAVRDALSRGMVHPGGW